MQQLLLSIRAFVPNPVGIVLNEFNNFFKKLCTKKISVEAMQTLECMIPLTLCKLERIFSSTFFDVMVYLPIQLVLEARFAGPVHYRWMYLIERCVQTFIIV